MNLEQLKEQRYEFEEISWSSPHEFKILWVDGHESRYLLDFLRVNCPCAACQGHGAQSFRPVPPEFLENPVEAIPAAHVEPVGSYAIGIRFSDGHDTGIFSFRFLRNYCPCETCREEANTREEGLETGER
jgi:DUF971 family protein